MTNDTASEKRYRLPYDVAPRRYDLRLAPDLAAASFSGEEAIEIEVLEATDHVLMHAEDLEVSGAELRPGWASAGDLGDSATALEVKLAPEDEEVDFTAPQRLEAGRYTLSCTFAGVLNDKFRGFYRSHYVDEDGIEQTIATTQFEEKSARLAFPCFDEPDRKAVFAVTLDVPAEMFGVSNGPEIGSEELAGGGRRIRFGDTIPMSTYLVAFVVGRLEATEPVDVGGVALRVVHLPGKGHLTATAIEIAAHALGFFQEYFALPYPGEKVDLVALPDFAAGAMENLGCVTFREVLLLSDPANTSQTELERIAEVIEHELAHMWFGDLVTMRWWNGIWLNEAFATFMSLRCQDDYRPDWHCFVSFARDKSQALGVDGLHATRAIEYPVLHPDDAAAMFDVLTYQKGASVLWMIEQFLGAERFRAGVRRYLAQHRLGNTETTDLWDAIEAEAGDVPIRAVMDSWIFQGGYPLVSASSALDGEGREVVALTQQPFAYRTELEDALVPSAIGEDWLVPVIAAPPAAPDQAVRVLLGPAGAELQLGGTDPVIVNSGGSGFYRVHYDAALTAALLGALEALTSLERYNLANDSWAQVVAGLAQINSYLDVVERLRHEADPHVWSVVIGSFRLLDLVAAERVRPALAAYVRRHLRPVLDRIGWERAASDDDQTPVLRANVIAALGTIGDDPEVIERARQLFAADQAGTHPFDADLATSILGIVAQHATESEFDAILERYRHPHDPLDEMRHLYSLGSLSDVELAKRVHDLCLTEIRSQNAPYLLHTMLASRAIGEATWRFVSEHFDELVARFPENSIQRLIEGVTSLVALDEAGEPRLYGDVRAFLDTHFLGGKRRLMAQSLERLAVNIAFAQSVRPALGDVLAAS